MNPLIVALDVPHKERAISLVEELKDYVSIFKVGPILFTRYGPDIVREIKGLGRDVFLDLKLYDIPNTVSSTVKAITELGVSMFTVHISGGIEMLRAAVEASNRKSKVLGVTVLTSVSDVSTDEVLRMVNTAKEAGLDGVISSPLEVKEIRKHVGKDFLIVTPGIRPGGFESGDQRRTATPKTAIQDGADYIVVGRPIIESDQPVSVVKQILSGISSL